MGDCNVSLGFLWWILDKIDMMGFRGTKQAWVASVPALVFCVSGLGSDCHKLGIPRPVCLRDEWNDIFIEIRPPLTDDGLC
jgi:hypothetical protein